MRTVTLYGRPGCHLCDEARAVLERVRATHPFTLAEVDIEADDALFKRYLERIPVVALDGAERFELFVDEETLRAELGGPAGDIPHGIGGDRSPPGDPLE